MQNLLMKLKAIHHRKAQHGYVGYWEEGQGFSVVAAAVCLESCVRNIYYET